MALISGIKLYGTKAGAIIINVFQIISVAYDLNSYLFGTIFCCCIGVFPVVLATMFFFKQIFAKIKQTTQLLDEAEKRRLKRQKVGTNKEDDSGYQVTT